MTTAKKTIEEIILQHGHRGMDLLKEYVAPDFCQKAAEEIYSWKRGVVFLFTGFCVAGAAETDGPAGTLALAKALQKLSFVPVIVTDELCKNYFEEEGVLVEYMPMDAGEKFVDACLKKHSPVGLISIERCGCNQNGDYANMRGISIKEKTAPVDLFFTKTKGILPSVGVGDGGNEIGMGNLADIIAKELSLVPCVICVDHLVLATVSNWGGYGLAAALSGLHGEKLLMEKEEVEAFIKKTVDMGSVDGVSHERVVSVDGYPFATELSILDELAVLC